MTIFYINTDDVDMNDVPCAMYVEAGTKEEAAKLFLMEMDVCGIDLAINITKKNMTPVEEMFKEMEERDSGVNETGVEMNRTEADLMPLIKVMPKGTVFGSY